MTTPESVLTPSTRAEIESRRLPTAVLSDGTRIRCRRATLIDLLAQSVVPMEFLSAAQGIDRHATPEAINKVRGGLEQVAIWAALEPRLSAEYASEQSAAVWIGLFSLEDLGEIYAAVTGIAPTPMGAAIAEAFRGDATGAAGTAAPDGESVRAEAELVVAGGSVDLQHG